MSGTSFVTTSTSTGSTTSVPAAAPEPGSESHPGRRDDGAEAAAARATGAAPVNRSRLTRVRQAGWLRSALEIGRFGANQLLEDRAEQMAAALAFRTIFGLVPVTVIGLLVFHMFGGAERFGSFITQLLESAHLDTVQLPPAAGSDKPMLLADAVAQIITKIDSQVSFESIGIVGILVLGWAAIRLMTTIERSFNTVVRAEHNRPLMKRVPLYWTTLTVGPALLYVSFFVNSKFSAMVHALLDSAGKWSAGLVGVAGMLISLGSTWLFVLLLFMLVPNTRVKAGPAAIGALVTALCWSVGAKAMGGYISTAFGSGAKYGILYGTLGLIPVFLLWVYLMWIVILFGLEITSIGQTYRGKRLTRIASEMAKAQGTQEPKIFDPTWILVLMKCVVSRFETGHPTSASHVSVQTGLDRQIAQRLLTALEEAHYVNEVVLRSVAPITNAQPRRFSISSLARVFRADGKTPEITHRDSEHSDTERRYVLARPAQHIPASDVLCLAQGLASPGVGAAWAVGGGGVRAEGSQDHHVNGPSGSEQAAWQTIDGLRQRSMQALEGKTLADI